MKKARLIYNPSAGKEEVTKNLSKILDTLESLGYESSTFATKGKSDAKKEARRVSKLKFDLIVVAGGDGTLNEVVNGISSEVHRPDLAILPFGTSNDFANALGVPRQLEESLRVIKKQKIKEVDIGYTNKNYFINVAGGGRLTELSYEVPSRLKTALGQLAYYIKGIEKIVDFKPYHIKFETLDSTFEEEVMLFLVSNSNVMGGFDKIAPYASLNDGLFDVLILKKCNLAELARVMAALVKGEHLNDPKIIHFQTPFLKVETSKKISINLDGELGGKAPCQFKVLKKHLRVFSNI